MSIPQIASQGEEKPANPAPSNNIAPSERRPRQRPRDRASPRAHLSPAPRSKLWWALKLARERGFKIFPLRPGTKNGTPKDWPNIATSDTNQIRAWWEAEPEANIGVSTAGLLVVDLDVKKKEDNGLESWRHIVDGHEMLGDAPGPTMTVKTWSGGYHLYFTAPPGGKELRSSIRKLGPGIDIKSTGGYVVGPGSVVEGKPYVLLGPPPMHKGGEPETYGPPRPDAFIVPLGSPGRGELPRAMHAPDWLTEKAQAVRDRSKLAGVRLNEETPNSVEAARKFVLERAPRPAEGERNSVAYQVAAEAFDYGIELSTGHDLMGQWNDDVGLDTDELETTVESAYKNRRNGIGVKNPDLGDKVFEGIEWPSDAEVLAKAPPKVKLKALILPDRNKWNILDFEEAAALARLARDPLIKGVLSAGEISVTYGVYGTRKTMTMMDMFYAIAAGIDWHGYKVEQGAVVWVAAEGGLGVYPRIDALLQHYKPARKIPFGVIERPLNMLTSEKDTADLIQALKRKQEQFGQPIKALAIDTMAAVSPGSDEGSAAMGLVMANVGAIQRGDWQSPPHQSHAP